MRITQIKIKKFRILSDVTMDLDPVVTLIVGKNNSGKTSLTEIFNHFFSENEKYKFKFNDFSLNSHGLFQKSYDSYLDYEDKSMTSSDSEIKDMEERYKALFPKIEAKVFIEYDEADDDKLSALSNFLMDLDTERRDATILCQYSVFELKRCFQNYQKNKIKYKGFIDFLANNENLFEKKFFAVDKDNTEYQISIEKQKQIEDVFLPRFIRAKVNLDDNSDDKSRNLSKGFENYYKYNKENNKGAEELKKSLDTTSETLDRNYEDFFSTIFTDLQTFGIDTGIDNDYLRIKIKSSFEVEEVLKDNANLFYQHQDEKLLPEKSNGLGYSKLISIILSILNYYEEQKNRKVPPNFGLLFIEEPEAHLHPQMQQVFIKNIRKFIESKNWNVQIVITTHSSHIVADSGFDCIRYFDNTQDFVKVKNLSTFKSCETDTDELKNTKEFLKQYLTLYKCDMFFADKIIMIEGTVERLLLPKMIEKVAIGINNQYVTIIEVGGAYAKNFKELLAFLNVKTLIITDIDAVKPQGENNKNKACPVSEGKTTSNATLKKWLPNKTKISDLLSVFEKDKIENDIIRVAYQIPEQIGDKCGRSFEEAFILKNVGIFLNVQETNITSKKIFLDKAKTEKKSILVNKTEQTIIDESYQIAENINKTDFAFDILYLNNWEVPLYIKQGLEWLQQ